MGSTVNLHTNYFMMRVGAGEVAQYHIDIQPEIESRRLTHKIVKSLPQSADFGTIITDGSLMFARKRFEDVTAVEVTVFDKQYTVTIKHTATLTTAELPPSAAQLFNIIMRKCYRELGFMQIQRNFFNPKARVDVKRYNLEIWPGFTSSIMNLQKGVMLNADICRKVVRQESALDVLRKVQTEAGGRGFEDKAKSAIVGMVILTSYNNRTYRIKDIDFHRTPLEKFEGKDKKSISLMEYYETKYSLRIRDQRQPLLIAEGRKGDTKEILLVPEFSRMTGLTDAMISDFNMMKAVAEHTRIAPDRRLEEYQALRQSFDEPKAREIMENWGIQIFPSMLKLQGKVLPAETIYVKDKGIGVDPAKGDWKLQSQALEKSINLPDGKWVLVVSERNVDAKDVFLANLNRVAGPLGIRIGTPIIKILKSDSPDSFIEALDSTLQPDFSLAVCILPNDRKDRYDAIKQFLCTKKPLPSQCLTPKALMKNPNNLSVVTKICQQVQAKIGGELWRVKVPLQGVMIIGIDVYHDTQRKGTSVLAFCASISPSLNKYFSVPSFQSSGQEIADSLARCMTDALEAYKNENNKQLPKHIVIYRDGVGLGQLPTVKALEIPQIKRSISQQANYTPNLVFVVVTKKINTRFITQFKTNPTPGTVVDHTIVRPNVSEFFLVAQHVNQGTAGPTHYEVLENSGNMRMEDLQSLTFKLCHTYFNWLGTVRVPSPCQYAHKLAFLIGQSVHQNVHRRLSCFLYFL